MKRARVFDRRVRRAPEEITMQQQHDGGGAMVSPPPASPAAVERNGTSTRRRVIEAGARVFAEVGFHRATKEQIGKAAGFSHQTVRDKFPHGKEELLATIVADAWRTVHAAIAERADSAAIDQLMAAYDALDALVHTRPAEARCVLHEARIAGPNGRPLVIAEEQTLRRAIEHIVARASGLRGAAAAARAEVMIAAIEGLTRPSVLSAVADANAFSADEARVSFRMLAVSMLHPS